jgi:NitT/TauT family transport system substrate-binding protein
MFLARSLGHVSTDLSLLETATVQDSIKAIRNGAADGAMLTLDEVLQLRDQGVTLQIVLVFDVSKGADVLLARAPVRTLADLKGRRIGAENSALGSLMLAMVLEKAELQARDVQVRRIAFEEQEAAWARGDVDALLTYEPIATRLKKAGARQLLSTREMPDTVFDVLAVRPAALETHGHILRAGLEGYFKSLNYLRQNPWDAAYRTAPHLGVTAEEMIGSLRGLELPDLIGNLRYLSTQSGDLQRVTDKLSRTMLQAGIIRQPVDSRMLYTDAYLPTAAASR